MMLDSTQDLEAEFEELLTGYYASCTYFNDVPSDWGVTIIEVACKFIDDNGNNDNKGSATNLPGNGASFTLNSSYNGCCRSYIGLVKVRDRGQIDIYPFSKTVDAGYCGGNLRWHLVPSRARPTEPEGKPRRFELVEE